MRCVWHARASRVSLLVLQWLAPHFKAPLIQVSPERAGSSALTRGTGRRELVAGKRYDVVLEGFGDGDAFKQLGERDVEAAGNLGEIEERDVAATDFDRCVVAAVHADIVCELFLAYVALRSQLLDAQSEPHL